MSLVGADPRELLALQDQVEELKAELGERHAELVEHEAEITNLKYEVDQVVSGVVGLADARKSIRDLEHERDIQDQK
jgi:cell division protein FtsB